jgi:hypothetical protein
VDIAVLDPSDDAAMAILGQASCQLGTVSSLPLIKEMWARGGEGVTLFHSSDDKVSLTQDQGPILRTLDLHSADSR